MAKTLDTIVAVRRPEIVAALGEALGDRTDRVRRRAMATLGELLFYIATQQADAAQACVWHVTGSTLALVTGLLQKEDDEITQARHRTAAWDLAVGVRVSGQPIRWSVKMRREPLEGGERAPFPPF